MGRMIGTLEEQRLALQAELDSHKSQVERNRLGQFATPTALAEEILKYAATLLPSGEKVRFLDPAFGTGAFYSALLKVFAKKQIAEARGYEIDPYYGKPAAHLWEHFGLTLKIATLHAKNPRLTPTSLFAIRLTSGIIICSIAIRIACSSVPLRRAD